MAHTKSLPRPEAREADTAHSHIWFRGLVSVRTGKTRHLRVWRVGRGLVWDPAPRHFRPSPPPAGSVQTRNRGTGAWDLSCRGQRPLPSQQYGLPLAAERPRQHSVEVDAGSGAAAILSSAVPDDGVRAGRERSVL